MTARQHHATSKASSHPAMVSVYDGTTCIGWVLNRGKAGFEAVDADERIIGLFKTQKQAADVLSDPEDSAS
jgi:hypothetical protein